ncbi:MAG: phosphoribosylformylglycinamidine cyclo-ligase [Chloroflexi bacterium]|nr:phosphoribosylformylglycinamidine cyclo-ligase [Chloroflexota bacterium]
MRSAYAAAGVDVEAGERAVELIRSRLAEGPSGDLLGMASFASAVPLPQGYREPVLVSATDGVGTKTAIAARLGRYETIGQDLVAMCADDVVCTGARPLFFLDYVAVGRVDPLDVVALVGGIEEGCRQAGCSLVGGETAEHPGLLEPDAFDLAGFCVGVVERSDLLDGRAAQAGDVLVGVASSGLHANGFSLVRQLISQHELQLDRPYLDCIQIVLGAAAAEDVARREPGHVLATLGEVLLTPCRIYATDLLDVRDALRAAGSDLHGLAHITGGGLPGNVPRALPQHLGARLDPGAWPVPSVFELMGGLGALDRGEMRAIFNGGLGMVAVVPPEGAALAVESLRVRGLGAWVVGSVRPVEELGGQRYAEEAE